MKKLGIPLALAGVLGACSGERFAPAALHARFRGHGNGLRHSSGEGLESHQVVVTRRPPANDVESVWNRARYCVLLRRPWFLERRVHHQREIGSGFEYGGDVRAGFWKWRASDQREDSRDSTIPGAHAVM